MPPQRHQADRADPHALVAKDVFFACLGLLLATIGAGLALVIFEQCATCQNTAVFGSGLTFAVLGGLYYCVSIFLLAYRQTRPGGGALVAGAFGVHIVLIKAMTDSHLYCTGCIIAAVGSAAAFSSLFVGGTLSRAMLATCVPVGSLALIVATVFLNPTGGQAVTELPVEYQKALDEAKKDCEVETGRACVVILQREGCAACRVLSTADEHQRIERQLGMGLRVTRREAPEGMPVPTVIIGTPDRWTVFRGAPDESQLIGALTSRH